MKPVRASTVWKKQEAAQSGKKQRGKSRTFPTYRLSLPNLIPLWQEEANNNRRRTRPVTGSGYFSERSGRPATYFLSVGSRRCFLSHMQGKEEKRMETPNP